MVHWLSIHADYGCGETGACCRSRWPIPVEVDRQPAIVSAVVEGRLPMAGRRSGIVFDALPPGAPAEYGGLLPQGPDGSCAFFAVGRSSSRCAIHRVLGPTALPAACRHFPRVCLIDARGIFVTLSHYCPTAAALLFRHDTTAAIVPGPPPLAEGELPEGLDAREALPPLLHPRRMTDLEGYSAWERHMIDVLVNRGTSVEVALRQLWFDADVLRRSSFEGGRSLAERVASLDKPVTPAAEGSEEGPDWVLLAREVRQSSPTEPPTFDAAPPFDARIAWERFVADAWRDFDRPLRAYLAARAFASWVAYQGQGLRTVVRSLQAALAVVRFESARLCAADQQRLDRPRLEQAFRQADLWLLHLADPLALARRWSQAEGETPRRVPRAFP